MIGSALRLIAPSLQPLNEHCGDDAVAGPADSVSHCTSVGSAGWQMCSVPLRHMLMCSKGDEERGHESFTSLLDELDHSYGQQQCLSRGIAVSDIFPRQLRDSALWSYFESSVMRMAHVRLPSASYHCPLVTIPVKRDDGDGDGNELSSVIDVFGTEGIVAVSTATEISFRYAFPMVDKDSQVGPMMYRVLEPGLSRVFGAILSTASNSGVVIDVGSNFGYFALLAASRGRHVFAFEPVSQFRKGN